MNQIVINADLGKTRISRHIYGHFAEHLGRCIYGGIWVGEESAIPNVRGIRSDVVDALRAIRIPNLRWPGGCFADEYHWMDGIGPRQDRPTMINTHWGGVTENNSFGTHEFLDLCAQLACEPYICGNVGSGTILEMQQWVEYITFDGISPMADLRRRNGRDEPWHLRYWGVGNENWGCGGHMRPEYYADLYRRYATYVRNFGENRIYKIACGPNMDDYHWTEVMMREARTRTGRWLMDGLSLHYYTPEGPLRRLQSATEFAEAEWFMILKKSAHMETLIANHSAIMDAYDPEKQVGLVVDEWGTWYGVEPDTNPGFLYQQNSLRDALAAAINLDIFNHHADRVVMANIAQTVNVLQALILTEEDSDRILLTPTYHVFDLYKDHQDAILLPLDVRSQAYTLGDDTQPGLSASASRREDGTLYLTVSNLNPHTAAATPVIVRGMAISQAQGRILTASAMQAHNTFDAPSTVQPKTFTDFRIEGDTIHLNLPPKSVLGLTLTSA